MAAYSRAQEAQRSRRDSFEYRRRTQAAAPAHPRTTRVKTCHQQFNTTMNLTMATDVIVTADSLDAVLRAKIITMVTLFVVSMIFGCLPMLLSLKFDWFTKNTGSDMRSSNQFVLGLLAFGGGVLFATTFMHLLPEVDLNVQLLQGEILLM